MKNNIKMETINIDNTYDSTYTCVKKKKNVKTIF